MENRKRNFQYAEKSGVSFQPQFWSWRKTPMYQFCAANDAGFYDRPNSAT